MVYYNTVDRDIAIVSSEWFIIIQLIEKKQLFLVNGLVQSLSCIFSEK